MIFIHGIFTLMEKPYVILILMIVCIHGLLWILELPYIMGYGGGDRLLFVTLPTSNYPKIIQIKRRYSIIHSDEYYVRLYYPVPSVIITKSLITKEAGTSPSKVWFPASHTHHRHAYVSARL